MRSAQVISEQRGIPSQGNQVKLSGARLSQPTHSNPSPFSPTQPKSVQMSITQLNTTEANPIQLNSTQSISSCYLPAIELYIFLISPSFLDLLCISDFPVRSRKSWRLCGNTTRVKFILLLLQEVPPSHNKRRLHLFLHQWLLRLSPLCQSLGWDLKCEEHSQLLPSTTWWMAITSHNPFLIWIKFICFHTASMDFFFLGQ